MRYYESLYIVNPSYEQDRLDEVMKTVSDKMGEYGFSIINHRLWGKKRLAYAIQKHKYGTFILLHYETETVENLDRFQRFMILEKPILRNQTVVLDTRPEVQKEDETVDESKDSVDSQDSNSEKKEKQKSKYTHKLQVLNKQKVSSKNFTKQIAFNVIPHIDTFMEDRYTKEEWKMTVETKKILEPNIPISATCVRVPVFVGHSESVNVEFNSEVNAKKIRECLERAPGCKVVDETKDGGYITPVESSGDFVTYISRIREDQTQKNSINMWIVSDNLLKGAALNAVQIATVLIKKYIS